MAASKPPLSYNFPNKRLAAMPATVARARKIGIQCPPAIRALEQKFGVKSGSINPNLFQDAEYKFGSIANPSAEIRKKALDHLLDCVEIGRELGSQDVSMWIADGSNYPGTQSIRKRIGWMEEVLGATHAALGEGQRMLVE